MEHVVEKSSLRRHDVASMSVERHLDAMCSLGVCSRNAYEFNKHFKNDYQLKEAHPYKDNVSISLR